ncbi:MAG: 2-C-methyl-D-erythritol 4-phosphate cytidylyltransferase [Lutispora sp.]|nr:2-C-methyl-D-erythritol 4-phosphate cytidylyltransferase [Lutispora sp.]MDD4833680.1 2-C-methyl-D-erythritol 4-phosphate cytidylyltransferase [Lutispora sp.]
MNTAIILAAGKGSRMNAGMNKLYVNIKGKPILAHTLDVFFACNHIYEIILVIGDGEEEMCRENVLDKIESSKPVKLVIGGKERRDSVYNGLKNVCKDADVILIHDGARPFITEETIEESIKQALLYTAVTIGIPAKDTIKEIDKEGFVENTPNRSNLWLTQTPQTFMRDVIVQAYESSNGDRAAVTDDATLVERMGIKVKMIRGSYDNIKITTPEDIALAEAILESGRIKDV